MGVENPGEQVIRECLHPLGHALPNTFFKTEQAILKRLVQFLVSASGKPLLCRIRDHLFPDLGRNALVRFLDEMARVVELGIAVIVDLDPPGNHLQGRGNVGLGRSGGRGNGLEAFGVIPGRSVLGSGNLVRSEHIMNLRGQIHLNSLTFLFDPMGRSVVQGDPVWIQPLVHKSLDQIQGFFGGGQPFLALDLADLGLVSCPGRNERSKFQIGCQIGLVGEVGGIDGNGGHPGIEKRRDLYPGPLYITISLDGVMVRMDGNRNLDLHGIAHIVHLAGQIPEGRVAIGLFPALGFGDLEDHCGIGPLGSGEHPLNDKEIAPVGSNGHGFALGAQCLIDGLATDNKGS